jgi:hypothetical protein
MTKKVGGHIGRPSNVENWAKTRQLLGRDGNPYARIMPDENVLIGQPRIMRYLGIKSRSTLIVWIELYGLPVVMRPDGRYMTTMTAVDQWLFLASELDNENRAWSRAVSGRYSLYKSRLERRIRQQRFYKEQLDPGEAPTEKSGLVDGGPTASEAEKV